MSTQAFTKLTFKPKEILFKEGEKADKAYIIKKGSVTISKKGPSGQNIPIATAEKGGIVGEMAVVSDSPRSATVTAQDTVEVIAISKASFETRLENLDPFLHSLIKTVITRLRKTSNHTVTLYEKVKSAKNVTSKPIANKKKENNKASFANVNFMLADPNTQTRNSLRGGLFGFGFREICDVNSYHQIPEFLDNDSYDLLVLDTAYGINQLCDLLYNIRNGLCGKNPFISILILTELDSKKTHQTLMNAGCDKVLMKPVSIQDVTKIIHEMCKTQRDFVVTRDYAGPDRPGFKEEAAKNAPQFSAPNTLGAKVFYGISNSQIEKSIQKGMTLFNEMKMECNLVQLAWLLERLDPKTGEPFDTHFILDKVDTVLEDLGNRASQSRFENSFNVCQNMRELVITIKEEDQTASDSWDGMTRFYNELLENIPLLATPPTFQSSDSGLMN